MTKYMERNAIINSLRHYFRIEELVCDHIYDEWGERSWQFLDTDFLHCLLIIRRDILQRPMICNNKTLTQRGVRCNLCDLVNEKKDLYMSSHILGKAGDFTILGIEAEEARALIKSNAHLLPCNIRIESGVSWLHFDVLPQYGVNQKVYEF